MAPSVRVYADIGEVLMSLLDLAADEFDSGVKQRGQEYFEDGAVRITHAADDRISARVQGTDRYNVKIRWDQDGRLDLRCTCPYFQDNGPCKHIWATLLQADEEELLPKIQNGDGAAGDEDDDDDEDDSDDGDGEDGGP